MDRRSTLLLVVLGVIGVVLCWLTPEAFPWNSGLPRWLAIAITLSIALALALFPPSLATLEAWHVRLRKTTPASRRQVALVIAILAGGYLYAAAIIGDRPLVPRLLDEKTYVVQSRLVSRGMLWHSAHPLARSFETFYILDSPRYGPKYFPGTAMLLAGGVWLHVPDYVTALAMSSLVVGLTSLIAMELFGGDVLAGIAAALLLVSTGPMHDMATWTLAHMPTLLCATTMLYCHLRWRTSGRVGWAAGMGVAGGWGAITRPIDAAVYALPTLVVILIDLWRKVPHADRRRSIAQLALAVLLAAPFLSLQLIFDKAMTGQFFLTPYRAYIDKYQPGDAYGQIGSNQKPQTTLQQKLDYYYKYIVPLVRDYQQRGAWTMLFGLRLRNIAVCGFCMPIVFLLLPAGVVAALNDRRLLFALLAVPLMLLLYLPNPSFFWYYPVIVAPAEAILLVAGAWMIARRLDSPALTMAVYLFPLAVGIGSIPELFGNLHADYPTLEPSRADVVIAQQVHAPALVFLTYHSSLRDFHKEPCFALETGWPDDERIIRAQDLGLKQNEKLIRYYAEQPVDRHVYVIDRTNGAITNCGTVKSLVAASALPQRTVSP